MGIFIFATITKRIVVSVTIGGFVRRVFYVN